MTKDAISSAQELHNILSEIRDALISGNPELYKHHKYHAALFDLEKINKALGHTGGKWWESCADLSAGKAGEIYYQWKCDCKILTNAQVIEFARFYLSECSATNDNLSDNPTGEHSSPEYKWFGCETDAELLEEIQKSAFAEGNLIPTRADHLVRVLDVMYFS